MSREDVPSVVEQVAKVGKGVSERIEVHVARQSLKKWVYQGLRVSASRLYGADCSVIFGVRHPAVNLTKRT